MGAHKMIAMTVALLAAASVQTATADDGQPDLKSMTQEESPEVFLARATLQQYLSRVVRKDWDSARRLTHRRALAAIAQLKERTGREQHNLAPWADREAQLRAFRFRDARQVAPGVVAISVSEETWHSAEKGVSEDDPAVYLLFHSRGGFLVGDKKAGTELADVTDESIRAGYRGWVDAETTAQARRAEPAPRR